MLLVPSVDELIYQETDVHAFPPSTTCMSEKKVETFFEVSKN